MITLTTDSLPTWFKLSPIALAAVLSACGGTGQDIGASKPFSQTFQGLAIDGYIARSLVFIDYDNNGTRDPWEPSAFTDNDGYFSYNPKTDTNYCAPGTPENQAIYCLVSTRPIASAVIRIDGGYDVLTGEPFVGQLSRRETVNENDSVVDTLVSPLTSLLTDIHDTNDRSSVLNSLQIQESDLDVDYLNTDGSGSVNTQLLNTALKVHKVVTVLSDRVTDTYSEIGNAMATPNDLSGSTYKHLASQLINSGTDVTTFLSDPANLRNVLTQTETDAKDIYTRRDFELSFSLSNDTNLTSIERAANNASQLTSLIDNVINVFDTSIDSSNIKGRARAIESVVIKNLEESFLPDTSIDNAVSFFNNPDNSGLVDTLITSLSRDTADLAELARNDFTGEDFDDTADMDNASQLPEGTVAFNDISGMQLRVSDLDLGWGPGNLKDSEVEVYFHGSPGDLDGRFSACVKYIDGAHVDGTLGEANTRGELVDGFWSLLGTSTAGDSSYSMLLTITFLGATYQSIVKPNGSTTVDGVEMSKFRFDYSGEISTWYSLDGLQTQETIPTTNKDCETLLPSRIGL